MSAVDGGGVVVAKLTSQLNSRTLGGGPATSEPSDAYLRSAGAGAAVSYPLPAATGSGRVLIFENADTASTPGVFTITPNGTDKVRGVNASVMCVQYADQIALVDGAAGEWDLVDARLSPVVITTSGNWTCPLTGSWEAELIGGGGGGAGGGSALTTGGITNQQGGPGGGAGEKHSAVFSFDASTSYPVTIGAGGVAGGGAAANGNSGTPGGYGGITQFSTLVFAMPGTGGQGPSGNAASGGSSGGGPGALNVWGPPPGYARVCLGFGGASDGTFSAIGGGLNGIWGGASGGSATGTLGGGGGEAYGPTDPLSAANNQLSPGGTGASTTTSGLNGQAATQYGCGGAGGGGGAPGGAGGNGGNGGPGLILLTWKG